MAEADRKNTIDFDSPDWLSIDAAFKRFVSAARGDPYLALRDLQQALEDDRLKSGYVRMPSQYRNPDGTLVWIPEHEDSGPLSYQFWRSEAQLQRATTGVRCVPRSGKVMAGRYLIFLRLSDLDAVTPEPATATAATPEPALNKEALAKRLIQELYGRPPHEIEKRKTKTGTVRTRVNAELMNRNRNAERFSWDTINRALGRDQRRKK